MNEPSVVDLETMEESIRRELLENYNSEAQSLLMMVAARTYTANIRKLTVTVTYDDSRKFYFKLSGNLSTYHQWQNIVHQILRIWGDDPEFNFVNDVTIANTAIS